MAINKVLLFKCQKQMLIFLTRIKTYQSLYLHSLIYLDQEFAHSVDEMKVYKVIIVFIMWLEKRKV